MATSNKTNRLGMATLLCVLLWPAAGQADSDSPEFARPLERLSFSEHLEQYQFERASLCDLQVSDPMEPVMR